LPTAVSPETISRSWRAPTGSMPMVGSSRNTISGSCSSPRAMCSRWPHAAEEALHAFVLAAGQADEFEQFLDAGALPTGGTSYSSAK